LQPNNRIARIKLMKTTTNNRRIITQAILKRLFKRVQISTELFYQGTPCWIWIGSKTIFDYGVAHFGINGRTTKFPAHKLFYELFVEITSDGMVVDHLCRNTLCVNPVHTEAVPQQLNVHRGIGVCAENFNKTHCPQGHPLTEANLDKWTLKQGRRACKVCKNDKAHQPPKRLLPKKESAIDIQSFQTLQQTDRLPTSTYLLARLFSKILISTKHSYKGDPCWEWQACVPKSGYGQVFFQHPIEQRTPETYLAHRLFYELFVGAVPESHRVAHLCQTKHCVNPVHLVCDSSTNLNKWSDNAAARNSRKTHCPKGHILDGLTNRNTRYCKQCARDAANLYYREKKNRLL